MKFYDTHYCWWNYQKAGVYPHGRWCTAIQGVVDHSNLEINLCCMHYLKFKLRGGGGRGGLGIYVGFMKSTTCRKHNHP